MFERECLRGRPTVTRSFDARGYKRSPIRKVASRPSFDSPFLPLFENSLFPLETIEQCSPAGQEETEIEKDTEGERWWVDTKKRRVGKFVAGLLSTLPGLVHDLCAVSVVFKLWRCGSNADLLFLIIFIDVRTLFFSASY